MGRNDILIKESCHDDIRFANEFSRSFVDNAERSYEQRSMNSQDETMMNLHNSEAGRMVRKYDIQSFELIIALLYHTCYISVKSSQRHRFEVRQIH